MSNGLLQTLLLFFQQHHIIAFLSTVLHQLLIALIAEENQLLLEIMRSMNRPDTSAVLTRSGSSSFTLSFRCEIIISYSFLIAERSGLYVLKSSMTFENTSRKTFTDRFIIDSSREKCPYLQTRFVGDRFFHAERFQLGVQILFDDREEARLRCVIQSSSQIASHRHEPALSGQGESAMSRAAIARIDRPRIDLAELMVGQILRNKRLSIRISSSGRHALEQGVKEVVDNGCD